MNGDPMPRPYVEVDKLDGWGAAFGKLFLDICNSSHLNATPDRVHQFGYEATSVPAFALPRLLRRTRSLFRTPPAASYSRLLRPNLEAISNSM